MAGDWIKLEHATISKPEVIAMADLLEKSPEEVFGMLFHVWCWFDKQSRDGNAGSVTGNALMRYIDHIVRRPGFAASMKQVGWLTDSGMPNFDRHNGESAKKRALTNDRVKRSRNAKCNADVTPDALPEKRREEKKKHISKTGATAPDGFLNFWKSWPASPRKGGKSECLKRWLVRDLESQAAVIVAHVEAMKSGKQWADANFIPAPLTYLNQSRWDGAEASPADDPYKGVTW